MADVPVGAALARSRSIGGRLNSAPAQLHRRQTDESMIEVANHASISVKELVRTSKSWDGKSLVPYPQGQPEITILRISIPAGARLETHSHPVINAGVL